MIQPQLTNRIIAPVPACGDIYIQLGGHSLKICDPLWEKVPLGGKYILEIWAEIAKNAIVLANLLFVTGESYGLASTISRWSGVNTLLLALVASLQSCGRRLEIYCVIEIPRAISWNSACGRSRTFTHRVRERKGLRTCGFRHRMQQASRFRMISVTQFQIFPPSGTFSQSGSHIINYCVWQLSGHVNCSLTK